VNTIKPLDFDALSTYSIHDRTSKVTVEDFGRPVEPSATVQELIDSLPNQLAAADLRELAERLARAHEGGKLILVGMGAHVIKVGLSPLIIDLMERGIVNGIAMNGAGIVHDTEIAMAGRTSEEVAAVLGQGAFGAAKETGEEINQAINQGARRGMGLGESLGDHLLERGFPYNHVSILAQARKRGIPVTVHVALGTDIVHIHPTADGGAIGKTSYHDFRLFAALVARLDGGCYLNIGSAVLLPEVFLKALTVVRNLGHEVKEITTANFDFIRHYRPATNVVHRPTMEGGKGFHFTGHHELMIPLLRATLLERLAKGVGKRGAPA